MRSALVSIILFFQITWCVGQSATSNSPVDAQSPKKESIKELYGGWKNIQLKRWPITFDLRGFSYGEDNPGDKDTSIMWSFGWDYNDDNGEHQMAGFLCPFDTLDNIKKCGFDVFSSKAKGIVIRNDTIYQPERDNVDDVGNLFVVPEVKIGHKDNLKYYLVNSICLSNLGEEFYLVLNSKNESLVLVSDKEIFYMKKMNKN